MKVALLTPYWLGTKGGITSYVYNLKKEFKKIKDLHVSVISSDKGAGAITVTGSKLLLLFKIPIVLSKIKPNVIHCHGLELFLFAALLYKLFYNRRVKTVYTFHTQPEHVGNNNNHKHKSLWKIKIFNQLLKRCNLVSCVSNRLGEEIKNNNIIRLGNYTVTKPGVCNCYVSQEQKNQFKEIYKINNAAPVICTTSVFAWELKARGVEILIRSFKDVLQHYTDALLIIIGDGAYKKYLQTLAGKLNISNNIIFCGYVDNPFVALSIADIYCHISLQEGLPIALLEAMVSNKPVIASNIGGIPEVIINKYNGILVEPHINKVRDALFHIISNPVEAKKFAKNGKLFVQKHHMWSGISQQIYNLYCSL